MIYFIQDQGTLQIKIGFTDGEAGERLKRLQTGNAAGLELLGSLPGDKSMETELHARFAASRDRGEWFRPTPDLLRFILSTCAVALPPVVTPAPAQPTLAVQEATIKTMCVEVKALTIGGKQVTLSVFRQLKDGDLLDVDTGNLLGRPWGLVNYFWGECKECSHLHIVWQTGNELRRSCVNRYRPTGIRRAEREEDEHICDEVFRLLWLALAKDVLGGRRIKRTADSVIPCKLGHLTWHLKSRDDVSSLGYGDAVFGLAFFEKPLEQYSQWHQDEQSKYEKVIPVQVNNLLKKWEKEYEQKLPVTAETSRDDLIRLARESSAKLDGMRAGWAASDKQWAENYEKLAALDHLFIAV